MALPRQEPAYGFIRKFLSAGSIRYLSDAAYLLSSLLLSRLISPEWYGIFGMAILAYHLIDNFTDLGTTEAIIREPYSKGLHQAAYSFSLIKGYAGGILLALAAYPVAYFFKQEIVFQLLLILAISMPIRAYSKARIAVLKKRGRFSEVYKKELVIAVFSILLSLILAYYNYPLMALVLPIPVVALLTTIAFRENPEIDFSLVSAKEYWVKLKSLFRNIGLLSGVQYFFQQVDSIVLGKKFTAESLGLYNRAYSILYLPANFLLNQLHYFISRALPLHNFNLGTVKDIKLLIWLCNLFLLPFLILFALFAQEFSGWLWGNSWAEVGIYLSLLSPVIIVQPMIMVNRSLFLFYHKEGAYLRYTTLSTFSLLALVIIGAQFSAEAVAIAYSFNALCISYPLSYFMFYGKAEILKATFTSLFLPQAVCALVLLVSLIYQSSFATSATLSLNFLINSIFVLANLKRIKHLFVHEAA